MIRYISVTVDEGKPTEKVYALALDIDLSRLSPEGLREYALRDLTVKWVNANRKKGHTHMASFKGQATYIAPEPGTRAQTQVDPVTAIETRDLTAEEVARLEATIAKRKATIVRKANA